LALLGGLPRLALQSLLLLTMLLGSGPLLGIERAPVWRRAWLRNHGLTRLHGLAGPGQLAQAFSRPAGAGVALRVVLTRIVLALITPVIASVIAPVIALAGLLDLAGHHGPYGNSRWRQRGRAGHPRQIAQIGHALRQAAALGCNYLGAAQIGRIKPLPLGAHTLAAREIFGAHHADGTAFALVAVVVSDVDVVHHDVLVHVGDVARAVLIGGAKSLAGR
jgi:hypothetical protein